MGAPERTAAGKASVGSLPSRTRFGMGVKVLRTRSVAKLGFVERTSMRAVRSSFVHVDGIIRPIQREIRRRTRRGRDRALESAAAEEAGGSLCHTSEQPCS